MSLFARRRAWPMVFAALLVMTLALGWHVRGSAETGVAAVTAREVSQATVDRLDTLVRDRLAELQLEPTPVIDDDAYLRRVTVDLIGRIPTEMEYKRYREADPATRREALVRRLLNHERFADRWAIFFGDMLRVRGDSDGGRGLHRFITRSLRENRPYDQMVRQMLTAVGYAKDDPAAGFIIANEGDPLELAAVTSHAFLGVRMQCAQCHEHPFDFWTQEDYYHLAAYFGKTSVRQRDENGPYQVLTSQRSRLRPPREASGRSVMRPDWPFELAPADDPQVRRLSERLQAAREAEGDAVEDALMDALSSEPTGGTMGSVARSENERMERRAANHELAPDREALAAKLTDPRNPRFARAIVNRIWGELIGTGIVEPVDDFRYDNLPSHPALLDFLAEQFVANGYDLRYLMELIVRSETYQRGHLHGVEEAVRRRHVVNFAAAPVRRMPAEAMFDSLVTAGQLDDYKDRPGSMNRTRVVKVRVPKALVMDEADDEAGGEQGMPEPVDTGADPEASAGLADGNDPYAMEGGIDAEAVLAETRNPDPLAGMGLLDDEDAMAPVMTAEQRRAARLGPTVVREVERTYDARPRFDFAAGRVGPAPSNHFLRVFGQSSRQLLGEKPSTKANMRQALILLNGRLANAAARVGDMERMHHLLKHGNHEAAVRLAYTQTLTRQPTEAELARYVDLLEAADNPYAAMADLRWALLNSHEFRFLP